MGLGSYQEATEWRLRASRRAPNTGKKDRGARSTTVGVEENRYPNMTAAFVYSKQWGTTNNRNNVALNCINGTVVLGTS